MTALWPVLVAVLALALSLRGPIVALAPVLPDLARDLSLGPLALGLLATAPVLAFSLASPLAVRVIRRLGPEGAVLASLTGTLVSQLVRAVPHPAGVTAGTVLLGVSVTVGNVVVPVVVRRDVPSPRVGLVMGAYTAFLNVGTLLTAAATAPVAQTAGWPTALALWSVLPALGLLVWAIRVHRRRHLVVDPGTTAPRPLSNAWPLPASRRRAVTALLTIAFAAQSFSYYAYTTWLPTYLSETSGATPTTAGALAATFQGWGVVGGLLVPLLLRLTDLRRTTATVGAAWVTTSLGVLLAPDLVTVWLCLGGLAQAAGFAVLFTGIALATETSHAAGSVSATVQGLGYAVAACAGPAVGALRSVSGGWSAPLALLVVTTTVFALTSVLASIRIHSSEPVR